MEKQNRPKIALDGAVFIMDAENEYLTDNTTPHNKIDLSKHRNLSMYEFILDRTKRNSAIGSYLMPDAHYDLNRIRLPVDLFKMDRIPSDEKIKEINQDAESSGMNFALVDSALDERLSGKLPTLDIHGDLFTVDLRFNALRSETLGRSFHFDNFDGLMSEDKCHFFYHVPSRQLCFPDYDISEMPKDICLVEIDGPRTLDPVGYATTIWLNEASFYPELPIKMHHTAKIIPLEETKLGKIIEENIRYQESRNTDFIQR